MNICFCVDSMGSGGAERVVASLANAFFSIENRVSIIMVSTSDVRSFYTLKKGIKVMSALPPDKKASKKCRVLRLREAILEINPDVVIAFLPHVIIYTYFAIKKLRIPFVVSERNDPASHPWLMKYLNRFIFNRADFCIFQTRDALSWYGKRVSKKSCIVPNPLSADIKFTPYAARTNEDKGELTIVSVGRLVPQKNFPLLLEAFSRLLPRYPKLRLTIYGDGPLLQILEQRCESLGIAHAVTWAGNCSNWLKASPRPDFFVLPSSKEGMPNALMEAMAAGIPSVSTDCPVGGPRALIRNGENGLLVPMDDADMMADAMNSLICDPRLRERISASNIAMVDEFSLESISKEWMRILLTFAENASDEGKP